MDLWIHCMLCGSEWRGDTIREPRRRTIKPQEEREPGEVEETKDTKDTKETKEEKEQLIVSKSNLNPSMD